MKSPNINNIDVGKLAKQLPEYEKKWVAISEQNKIVASGESYGDTVKQVKDPSHVVLLKVPPLDVSFSPNA
jgi:Family of unknown function (DUF5678)